VNRFVSRLVVCLVMCLFLVSMSCGGPSSHVELGESSVKPAVDRNVAPDFELKDENGKTVKLSDYEGQVVLLNFWATWCGPCKMEIPWFVEFEKKNRDRGFAVLGVSMDEDGWDSVKPYLEYAKVNYRVLIGNDQVAMMYGGVDSLPTTFLIDHDGKIAAVHIGLVSKTDYETDIQTLLEQKTDS
jgi:peroxiredoxin